MIINSVDDHHPIGHSLQSDPANSVLDDNLFLIWQIKKFYERDVDSIFLWLLPLFISSSLTFIRNRHKAQNEIFILSQQDVINQNMLLDIKEKNASQ